MLNLSYTVEKEGNLVSVSDRLMISEYQINNLMDTLVSHGYTVEKMSVAPATL
jgi:biotin operon repressor